MTRIPALLLALSLAAAAQAPKVAAINFYGLHKVAPERILGALGVKPGDPLPPSKGELEDALERVPGVVLGRVEVVCCEGTSGILFIGVEEKGAPHFEVRPAPAGAAVLPPELVESYDAFLAAVGRAAARGNTAEDLTAGHSLMAAPEARALQLHFADFAAEHVPLLRDVLRNGAEGGERAIAAAVIGYAPKKAEVADDLQYALGDPDEAVRANAMRALTAFAVMAARNPGAGVRVAPTWFVEALHSVVLSDRVEAVKALTVLTDRPNPAVLDLLRARALPDLVEMARWQTLAWALPPFVLAGRVAGLADERIQRAWEDGSRETLLRRLAAPAGRRR